MWPTLLLGLLVASVAGWIITAWFQIRRIRRLERSHEEIQVEETLVFDFLHGLGEAFQNEVGVRRVRVQMRWPHRVRPSWRATCEAPSL